MDAGRSPLGDVEALLACSGLGPWAWDLQTGALNCSAQALAILGLGSQAQLDIEAARRLVHPEDVEAIWASDEAARAGRPFHADYRIVRPDGQQRWVAHHAAPRCDAQGRPCRVIGTLCDITDRKAGEEALRAAHDALEARVRERTEALALAQTAWVNEVTERRASEAHVRELLGQIVVAEEDERRRIARELHDTVGQHLTALSLGLKSLEADPAFGGPRRERLKALQHVVRQLDNDIDRLSHELRPSALDDLGLDDALREHARAWAEDACTAIDIHTHGLRGRRFPQTVETTVYRVVQEALTNVRKHAGAHRVGLIAEHRGAELRVIVEDDGCGFDTQNPGATGLPSVRRRLGLRGMAERAAMVGGSIEVESAPGSGTTLYLTIPLPQGN